MAVKISQLSASANITSDDFFPVVDSGSMETKRGSAQQILNYVTGSTFNSLTVSNLTSSNITGSTAQFTTVSGANANISGDLIVSGKLTAHEYHTEIVSASIIYESGSTKFGNSADDKHEFSGSILLSGTLNANNTISGTTAEFTTITSSFISASEYQGIIFPSPVSPGGNDMSIQFNSGSTFSGSTNLIYNYTTNTISGSTAQFTTISGSTVTGSTAQFTTITSSDLVVTGGYVLMHEPVDLGERMGDNAYLLFNSGIDKLAAFPGLYVTGAITASTAISASNIGATTAVFSVISASVVSASSYVNLPTSSGGIPGGTNQTIQFNSGSTFSGSNNLTWDYTNNRLGVGTSTPGTSIPGANIVLDVSSNGDTKMLAKTTGGAGAAAFVLQSTGHSNNPYMEFQLAPSNTDGESYVRYNYVGATTKTNILVVKANGNVGVGIVSPSSSLHVREAGSSTGAWRGRIVAGGDNVAFLMGEYNSKAWLGAHNAALSAWEDFYINPDGTNSLFMGSGSASGPLISVINSTGRVGIGKTSPNSTLDVNGNTIISGNLTVTGSIFVSGSSIYGQVAELTSSTNDYTLVRQDSGKFLHMSSSTAMNLTVPAGLPVGFTVSFCQNGTGSINIVTGSGVFVKNRQDHTKTAGYGAVASLICTGSNGYIFTGDTSA